MLPTTVLRALYYSLIESHLSYGCMLWGNACEKYLHRIKVLQKKAICVVCHAPYNAPSSSLFKLLNIAKFNDLCKVRTSQFMFKLYHEKLPVPLLNISKRNVDVHEYNTRQKEDFTIPKLKHHTVFRSFLCTGPRLWSAIPDRLKSQKLSSFSRNYKNLLVQQY